MAAPLPASSTFESFLAPDLDRAAFISAWLRGHEVRHTVVNLANKRHIVVRFDSDSYDPRFRMKTLVAHYDRAAGSPGANDNSTACFQLMQFAALLAERTTGRSSNGRTIPLSHNIRIFFTDGEEAAGTNGIAGQGAYALGSGLRRLKMTEDDVYVFDACGRGDTLVLSTAGLDMPGKKGARMSDIHERTIAIAREAAREKWVELHTPYSDNAGFLAAGIAAQVLTILPREEATTLMGALEGKSADSETAKLLKTAVTLNRPNDRDAAIEAFIPETWRLMHTANDTGRTLTASAFSLMEEILVALACHRDPLT
jgi:hypothetical protein